ncbi:MAG TPA: carboxylating nicotinate-nucleotide diphosphorylase [Gemmatimonadaceae bacterium]|jgi:nicotinate-nucleotide pyrophosphorylase (carboxylating)|nr:carboxylating nicotinate-nucleotide diphosphorylase [Gemmatimonadaceae bacterium]
MKENEPQRAPRRITPFETPQFASARFPLTEASIIKLVQEALDEDAAFGDITTLATVLPTRRTRAKLVAREEGVISGVPLALAAFRILDERVEIRVDAEDGSLMERGGTILYLSGHARGLLAAERTALNFMQHLSGVASLTRKFVDAVKGTRAAVVDTRKTLPGWRKLEKYAVRCGGGVNYRADLASSVLIKDNHLMAVDGDIALAVKRAREYAPTGTWVQVEVETPEQARTAVEGGAESILLDNMSNDQMRECVAIAKARCITEASGGVRLDNVRAIAETGVDRISIGALTHSAPALNLALDFE